MSNTLHIQIPVTYQNDTLTIKSLRLQGTGETAEKALLEAIKSTPYYTGLKSAKICESVSVRGEDRMHLEVPFSNTVYDAVLEIEPMPSEAVKHKLKSFIETPTAEETLQYGF